MDAHTSSRKEKLVVLPTSNERLSSSQNRGTLALSAVIPLQLWQQDSEEEDAKNIFNNKPVFQPLLC